MNAEPSKPGAAPRAGWTDGLRLTPRAALRYFLLQLPGWALIAFIAFALRAPLDLPHWLPWMVVAVWVGKDVVLFPFLGRFYHPHPRSDTHSLVGMRGTTQERLAPSGYVRVRGELWRAEAVGARPSIKRGAAVRVTGTRGLTLLVEPADTEGGG